MNQNTRVKSIEAKAGLRSVTLGAKTDRLHGRVRGQFDSVILYWSNMKQALERRLCLLYEPREFGSLVLAIKRTRSELETVWSSLYIKVLVSFQSVILIKHFRLLQSNNVNCSCERAKVTNCTYCEYQASNELSNRRWNESKTKVIDNGNYLAKKNNKYRIMKNNGMRY